MIKVFITALVLIALTSFHTKLFATSVDENGNTIPYWSSLFVTSPGEGIVISANKLVRFINDMESRGLVLDEIIVLASMVRRWHTSSFMGKSIRQYEIARDTLPRLAQVYERAVENGYCATACKSYRLSDVEMVELRELYELYFWAVLNDYLAGDWQSKTWVHATPYVREKYKEDLQRTKKLLVKTPLQ